MTDKLEKLIGDLRSIQDEFFEKFGVPDIFSSSKFFEVIIADQTNHSVIAGFSGFRDAKDEKGNEYEYKHYKESSSNHTWTFNDFSDSTIENLNSIKAVVFAHIDDSREIPILDWYYEIPGKSISGFLRKKTIKIKNTRKMINISPSQLETELRTKRTFVKQQKGGKYSDFINRIFATVKSIEAVVGTKDILTSNKIWEVLVADKLNHRALTEQTKFDAVDKNGNYYEYKVSKGTSWNFEDISENVLKKLESVRKIVLATVDKRRISVVNIFVADPLPVVKLLKEKLETKRRKYKSKGGLRRLQVSISFGDLKRIGASKVL